MIHDAARHILQYVAIPDMLSFRLVCRVWNDVVDNAHDGRFMDSYVRLWPTRKSLSVLSPTDCLKLMIEREVYDRDIYDYYAESLTYSSAVLSYRIAVRSGCLKFVTDVFHSMGVLRHRLFALECIRSNSKKMILLASNLLGNGVVCEMGAKVDNLRTIELLFKNVRETSSIIRVIDIAVERESEAVVEYILQNGWNAYRKYISYRASLLSKIRVLGIAH